ncbi:MAG: hypothetical protein JF606_27530 [Burkholderiales bacterium]|jgi:hypothetical protein|nr:hypothetical protein [Burkholderiales bacterium]
MLKKIGTLITSLSIALTPAGSLLSSTFSRATIGALVGTSAVMLPSAAHAQSGYRICSLTWGRGSMSLTVAMKVSKYDIGTCGGSWIAFTAAMSGFALRDIAASALSSSTGKSYHYNATCESFSGDVRYNGDICNSMSAYRLYSVFRGSLGKL